MRILLFLYISFEQFNIEKFKMRPQRNTQHSKFKKLPLSSRTAATGKQNTLTDYDLMPTSKY